MPRFNHRRLANQFIAIMQRCGADTHIRTAGTGTIYAEVDGAYKVRFSDHGDCYCTADISVDPDGCTVEQAVRAAGRHCDLTVTRSLASFKSAASRSFRAAELRRAAWLPELDAAKKSEAARLTFQCAYIDQHYPDYQTRTTKQRKRARCRANKAWSKINLATKL